MLDISPIASPDVKLQNAARHEDETALFDVLGRLNANTAAAMGEHLAKLHCQELGGTANVRVITSTESFNEIAANIEEDGDLLRALDRLTEALATTVPAVVHGSFIEAVRIGSVWDLADGAPRAVGPPAEDVGSFVAAMLIVAVDCAHAPDAPPHPEPTWPPQPLWTKSTIHGALHSFWQRYVAARDLADDASKVQLLKVTTGIAGCKILYQVAGGATSAFARLSSAERCRAKACALAVGRELILHSQGKLCDFDGIFTILDSHLNAIKAPSMPLTFEIFSDF